jgi:hypothetical protein
VGIDPRNAASEQNWRLRAELDVADDRHGALEDLIGAVRGPASAAANHSDALQAAVITHDGDQLFAYTADEATLQAIRHAIEGALAQKGMAARSILLSHWDSDIDDWRQIYPPATAEETQASDHSERDAETVETRTLVANVGGMIRKGFEQSLLEWASELGVQCKIIEHRHLLITQVGFTVTGSKRKLDEFSEGVKAEEWMTIRTETQVMLGPI